MQRTYKIEKIVSGGRGLVRDGEGAVFVPFVMPGETVRIGAVLQQGRRREAEAVEIVEASPERLDPPCPLFGRCGGCQLQHAEYGAQLRFKREIVIETLARIAGLEAEVMPALAAASPYHYRSRIKLQLRRGSAGFFAERGQELLPVERCWIARDELNALLASLSGIIKARGMETLELMLLPDGGVAAAASGRVRKTYRRVNGTWAEDPARRTAFTQVNPEMNEALKALVTELAGQGPCATAIDLYAGAGNLTLPLLRVSSRVTAVDSDPAAAELGRQSVGPGDAARVRFVNLYVSCDPATLARDLKDLVRAGYTLRSITPLDMFPQTAHVETVSLIVSEG